MTEHLAPLLHTLAGLDLAASDAAAAQLTRAHPLSSLTALRDLLLAERHTLAPRVATPSLSFGRIAKPNPDSHGFSVDLVDIAGAGAEHTHPKGEVSLCFATSGDPRFDGQPEGWVVLPPHSHHTPTVQGGRMLILYFQPEGAVRWGPAST